MIAIAVSHRMEELVQAFLTRTQDERSRLGPLAPLRLVVPNRNLETYLRFQMAERLGIAANIQTFFLHDYLAGLDPRGQVLDAALLQDHLLAVFHDPPTLKMPALAPLRRYLESGDEGDGRDRRCVELALRLSHLFYEYTLSRPALLAEWEARQAPDTDEPEEKAWQGRLWRILQDRLARGPCATTLLEKQVAQAVAASSEWAPVHLFGFSYLATAYHRMLAAIATRCAVHLYLLTPLQEDAQDLAASLGEDGNDPFGLLQAASPLALWARPSRENLRLLLGQPGASYQPLAFTPAPPSHLLARLQNDLALHQKPAAVVALDGSLGVFPCPSIRRELEVITAEIGRLCHLDSSVRLSDILVVVPEAQKEIYLTQIPTVFQENGALPHNLSDRSFASHPVAHALTLLLELPFATLSRKSLLPLLVHPTLLGRFPSVEPSLFPMILDQLGIVRGATREDLPYVDQDLFSFEQGLRRLALGRFFDSDDEVILQGEPYTPASFRPDEESAAAMGLLCCSLIADMRFAQGITGPATRPLAEWLTFIASMVDRYLTVTEDDRTGKTLLGGFRAALVDARDPSVGETPVRYRIACHLAMQCLEQIPHRQGQYLASGVTVASFVPMRAIPFRAIFVVGLAQGQFPRAPGLGELDLRRDVRLAGDVDPAEQDRHLLLETLLSARDFLGLSYVARGEVTGDPRPPSSVISDLRTHLASGFLGPEDLARLFRDAPEDRPPLRRYDDRSRLAYLPEARAEYEVAKLAQQMPVTNSWRDLPVRTPVANRAALFDLLRVAEPGALISLSQVPKVVTLSDLHRFLLDPLQGSARFFLHLYRPWENDMAQIEDEPMDPPPGALGKVVRTVFFRALSQAQGLPPWERFLEFATQEIRRETRAGKVPAGILGRRFSAEIQRHLEELHQMLAQSADPIRCYTEYHLGEGSDHPAGLPTVQLPVSFQNFSHTVDLQGKTGPILLTQAGRHQSVAIRAQNKPNKKQPGAEELTAFLNHLVLTLAHGSEAAHESRALFLTESKTVERVHQFASTTPAKAKEYLAGLCADLLGGGTAGSPVHSYLLPHEAILTSHYNGAEITQTIESFRNQTLASDHGQLSSMQGGVPHSLATYAPPDEASAQAMAQRRFGLFFDLLNWDGTTRSPADKD